jgi:hypothetical protein
MITDRQRNLYSQAKSACDILKRHFGHGAYRVIRDPEGVVSLWAIEGRPHDPFSLSFVVKGRVYNRIEDVPADMLKSFSEYVSKKFRVA